MQNFYKKGTYNAICDECGFKFKSDELKLRWDGLMVCDKDFELRNPQDFIKIPDEKITPPWTRPEAVDQFVNVTFRPFNGNDVLPP